MLPKRYRLRVARRSPFHTLFRGTLFSVRARDTSLGHSRVGVAVPLRYSSSSVRRNALRRRIYRLFTPPPLFLTSPPAGRDFLITVLTNEASLPHTARADALVRELSHVFPL